ncbi:MAG: hypothetical protein IKS97_05400 [Fibrobacter sp.]|nr:hypothetical protein [Fibrobacter sp.]
MNIKIEKEKKVYVAPSMDIVNMDHEIILCCSPSDIGCGGEEDDDGENVLDKTTKFNFEFY